MTAIRENQFCHDSAQKHRDSAVCPPGHAGRVVGWEAAGGAHGGLARGHAALAAAPAGIRRLECGGRAGADAGRAGVALARTQGARARVRVRGCVGLYVCARARRVHGGRCPNRLQAPTARRFPSSGQADHKALTDRVGRSLWPKGRAGRGRSGGWSTDSGGSALLKCCRNLNKGRAQMGREGAHLVVDRRVARWPRDHERIRLVT